MVLREFQTYVTSSDKAFAGATIQAIGRLAVAIQSETETCLNGLLHLLSSKDGEYEFGYPGYLCFFFGLVILLTNKLNAVFKHLSLGRTGGSLYIFSKVFG